MKLNVSVLVLTSLAIAVNVCFSAPASTNTPTTEVKTTFDEWARLSAEEVQEVIQLARKCGISNVTSINTRGAHLTSNYGIGVSGERVVGRKVYLDSFVVTDASWMGTNWHPKPQHINVGKFWAEPKITTLDYATFQISNQTRRIRLTDDLTVETADALVAAIAAGKVRFADQKTRDAWEGVKLTILSQMGQRNGEYQLTFTTGPLRWSIFGCEFKNGEILVKTIGLMMS
jgi:hypothetical protein